MKCLVVKLKPKSSFHLGDREQWREGSKVFFPADTLFSALCHCHQLLYGEVESFLDGFLQGDPPFLLSSAFPMWDGDYFFPLPKSAFLDPEEYEQLKTYLNQFYPAANSCQVVKIKFKEIKKIQFINLASLKELLFGVRFFDVLKKAATDPNFKTIPLIFFWHKKEEEQTKSPWEKKPWVVENVPRIALSRLSNHPGENFFHFGRVYYAPEASLFCLIKINQPQWETKVKALFYLLADEGVGGDRTCGLGLLNKPEFDELDLPEVDGQWLYCLSPYFPNDNELPGLADGFYELEERRGYIFSPLTRSLRRRSIRLFAEGSVFPRNIERRGKLVDVTPQIFSFHKIYRYGILFGLPGHLEARSNENQN